MHWDWKKEHAGDFHRVLRMHIMGERGLNVQALHSAEAKFGLMQQTRSLRSSGPRIFHGCMTASFTVRALATGAS